jgi:UTP--glucose-1-phosphate uridylyltransferase
LGDAIQMLIRYQTVYAYEFEGRRYDAGNVFDYIRAQIDFALMRAEFREDLRAYLRSLDLPANDMAGQQGAAAEAAS